MLCCTVFFKAKHFVIFFSFICMIYMWGGDLTIGFLMGNFLSGGLFIGSNFVGGKFLEGNFNREELS